MFIKTLCGPLALALRGMALSSVLRAIENKFV
jgi:hypothetical protein